MHQAAHHEPVMAAEVVDLMSPVADGIILDATFGGGGHSRLLLQSLPDVRILAIDRDPAAGPRAAHLGSRVRFATADFRNLIRVAEETGVHAIAGALFDLGLSSLQLDDPGRGFSYRQPGPLDMRLGPGELTAATIVNEWEPERVVRVLRDYGEERFAGRIAAAIVAARPILDTAQLADVVTSAIPAAARRRGGHPARRSFQALRIAVNDELGALAEGLEAAIGLLAPAGRIVVISYHSLEDRLVKRRFAAGAAVPGDLPGLPVAPPGASPQLRLLTRGALRPSAAEVDRNPRSRSARLRAAERLEPET